MFFFAFLNSLKKGVGSRVGSGSISQRYGSVDPDPHQIVTDPQHWLWIRIQSDPHILPDPDTEPDPTHNTRLQIREPL